MGHVLLKELNKTSQNWTVRARAVRFCDFTLPSEPDKRVRIDLILLDEEGGTIECQVPEFWLRRSKTRLEEDHIYKIKYFQVLDAKTSYRCAPHDYMVRFTYYTQIEEVKPAPESFPLYGHHLVSFNVLHTRVGNDKLTSDVIGVLTTCSPARDQNTQLSGVKRLKKVTITDGNETVDVALWGKHADTFDVDQYMEHENQKPIVVLFCAMTCRTFNDKLCFQTSALSRWYINPQLVEAEILRERCVAHAAPLMLAHEPQRSIGNEPKTIAELAAIKNPHIIDNDRYIVVAKLKEIVPDKSWWYLACNKCNKATRQVGDGFQCKDQSCTCTAGAARYRVMFRAIDPDASIADSGTPSIELVFFGPLAEELLGAPVHELLNMGGGVGTFLPKKIEEVYGKILTVQVGIGRLSFHNEELSFQVKRILAIGPTAKETLHDNTVAETSTQCLGTDTATGTSKEDNPAKVPTDASIQTKASTHIEDLNKDVDASRELAAVMNKETAESNANLTIVGTPMTTTPVVIEGKRKSDYSDDTSMPKHGRMDSSTKRKLQFGVPSEKSTAGKDDA